MVFKIGNVVIACCRNRREARNLSALIKDLFVRVKY